MYNASDISKWFLVKNKAERKMHSIGDEYEGISPLKLQKLLYYAQGIHLAINNTPLFSDNILAWPHGPVVNAVYQEYKAFGSGYIDIELNTEDEEIINAIENDLAAHESLELTYNNFAIYTAWQLRNMTHENGSPWFLAYNLHGKDSIIGTDNIKEYFLKNVFED